MALLILIVVFLVAGFVGFILLSIPLSFILVIFEKIKELQDKLYVKKNAHDLLVGFYRVENYNVWFKTKEIYFKNNGTCDILYCHDFNNIFRKDLPYDILEDKVYIRFDKNDNRVFSIKEDCIIEKRNRKYLKIFKYKKIKYSDSEIFYIDNKNIAVIDNKKANKNKEKKITNEYDEKIEKFRNEESINKKNKFVIEYSLENDFQKKESAVKKLNMLGYKELMFYIYPEFRKGKFNGCIVSKNKKEGIIKYELKLPTDAMFSKVYGDMILHYTVYEYQKIVMLDNITPDDILTEGHQKELNTYKDIALSISHAEKEGFKVELLNQLNKD